MIASSLEEGSGFGREQRPSLGLKAGNIMGFSTMRITLGLLVMVVTAWSAGCSKEQSDGDGKKAGDAVKATPRHVLVFPKEMEVADASVNAFVREVMATSASGDYSAFRLLWSARQQPLARNEFERGWDAVEEIRVLALERVALSSETETGEPETVYAMYADVRLDPERLGGMRAKSGKPADTRRKPILMFVREHGQWRIGRAPKQMCAWLKKKVDGDKDPDAREGGSDADGGKDAPAADGTKRASGTAGTKDASGG